MGGGNFLAGAATGLNQSIQQEKARAAQAQLQAERLKIQQQQLNFQQKVANEKVKSRESAIKKLQELSQGGTTSQAQGPVQPGAAAPTGFTEFSSQDQQSLSFDAIGGLLGAGDVNAASQLLGRTLGPTPQEKAQAQTAQVKLALDQQKFEAEQQLKSQQIQLQNQQFLQKLQLDRQKIDVSGKQFESEQTRKLARDASEAELRKARIAKLGRDTSPSGQITYTQPDGSVLTIGQQEGKSRQKTLDQRAKRQEERYASLLATNNTVGQLRDLLVANPGAASLSGQLAQVTQKLGETALLALPETDGPKGKALLDKIRTQSAASSSEFDYLFNVAVFNLASTLQGEGGGKLSDKDIEAAEVALGGGRVKTAGSILPRLELILQNQEKEASLLSKSLETVGITTGALRFNPTGRQPQAGGSAPPTVAPQSPVAGSSPIPGLSGQEFLELQELAKQGDPDAAAFLQSLQSPSANPIGVP